MVPRNDQVPRALIRALAMVLAASTTCATYASCTDGLLPGTDRAPSAADAASEQSPAVTDGASEQSPAVTDAAAEDAPGPCLPADCPDVAVQDGLADQTTADVAPATDAGDEGDRRTVSPFKVAGGSVTATAGLALTGPIASVTDTRAADTADQLIGIIMWGDGTESVGQVVGGAGAFVVQDSHTYAAPGAVTIVVTVTDLLDGAAGSGTFAATVLPAAKIDEFPVPTAGSMPLGIARGGDGNVWFTEFQASNIGRITPDGGVTEFPLPTTNGNPEFIAPGPDGTDLWFPEYDSAKIGSVSFDGGIQEYTLPNPGLPHFPVGITAGPGGSLWFTETGTSWITRFTPSLPPIDEFASYATLTSHANPVGLVLGPEGSLWFCEVYANKIGRLGANGSITEFDVPTRAAHLFDTAAGPLTITVGPDGNLWFTELDAARIGRLMTTGVFTEFVIPTPGCDPYGIAAGPDGNLWFTEAGANQIGRITPSGVITEFPLPTLASVPESIAAGADGRIWFAESSSDQIGRIDPGLPSP